ncbi:zinc finger C2HC domain-containing protein 1A-like isoform X3 [Photinus pyralis]|uniref:zinc finger C2HC domain-containing protein 1A-like isoform X3 n=1 Tax=Photinus pyralis TaxID=7054 RepID=UPI0012674AF3|nr:zinc finger C2HC domain-containing protein 1A-like isoform X3 [Photinus pyralis]
MAETTMEEVINLEGELVPCEICGRTFLPAPLIKHKKVCERNATKQRKIFDSQKQRVEGTEFAPFNQSHVKKTVTGTPYAADAFKRAKWKEKHLELVKTIRAARGVGMTNKHSASSTSLSHDAPGTERCPSCDRQFGPRAYDRHVEWCKDHVTYVHRSPAQVLLAKERLEARIKYRVPAPKSKRAVVKEKYSPGLGSRTESFSSIKSTSCTYLDNTHKVQKTKPVVNLKKSNEPSVYNQGDSAEINKRTERANRKNLEDHVDPINSKNAPTSEVRKPAPFKKSLSVQEPPKPKSNFKDDLQVEVLKKPRKSTELPSVDFAKGDDLFDVDDVMLEEFKKFEENYLKDKDKQRRKKERELHEVSTNVDNGGGSPVSKINIDSAYNSLNRNNPKVRAKPNSLSPLEYNRPQTSPIASPTSSSSDTTSMPLESQQRVSKFCHECGTRYPIITAKFCVECGVKRLVL